MQNILTLFTDSFFGQQGLSHWQHCICDTNWSNYLYFDCLDSIYKHWDICIATDGQLLNLVSIYIWSAIIS